MLEAIVRINNEEIKLGWIRGLQGTRGGSDLHCIAWAMEAASDLVGGQALPHVPIPSAPIHPAYAHYSAVAGRRSASPESVSERRPASPISVPERRPASPTFHPEQLSVQAKTVLPPPGTQRVSRRDLPDDYSILSVLQWASPTGKYTVPAEHYTKSDSEIFQRGFEALFPRVKIAWTEYPINIPPSSASAPGSILEAYLRGTQVDPVNMANVLYESLSDLLASTATAIYNYDLRWPEQLHDIMRWALVVGCGMYSNDGYTDETARYGVEHTFVVFPPTFPVYRRANPREAWKLGLLGSWLYFDPTTAHCHYPFAPATESLLPTIFPECILSLLAAPEMEEERGALLSKLLLTLLKRREVIDKANWGRIIGLFPMRENYYIPNYVIALITNR